MILTIHNTIINIAQRIIKLLNKIITIDISFLHINRVRPYKKEFLLFL
jgi:hypothetical protein